MNIPGAIVDKHKQNWTRNNDKLPAIHKVEQAPVLPGMMSKAASQKVAQVSQAKGAIKLNAIQEKLPLQPRSSKSKAVMIDQRYEIRKKIDEGTYAKVYLAQDWNHGGQHVVLKILRPKAYVKAADKAQVKKEIDNHAKLAHGNILKMLGHSYRGIMHVKGVPDGDNTYIYLVTEYLGRNYLNMFDLIESGGGKGFGEDCGRLFLNQMLNALEYLHSQAEVCHRDLKLENILIDSNLTFKLIDLGLSASGNLREVTGAVGSPSYVAPEVLEEFVYDGTKVDIFSMGVLLFIIVQGKFPHGTKILKDKYYDMIRNRRYDDYFQAVEGTRLSRGFKDLIVSLLAYKPAERPTIAQIRQSPFLQAESYSQERTHTKLLTKVHGVIAAKQNATN